METADGVLALLRASSHSACRTPAVTRSPQTHKPEPDWAGPQGHTVGSCPAGKAEPDPEVLEVSVFPRRGAVRGPGAVSGPGCDLPPAATVPAGRARSGGQLTP